MARALVWSPEAIDDVEGIAAYIERDSPWYARAVASKIVETAETIPRYPELGRVVPEIGDPAIASGLSIAIASFTVSSRRASLWRQ
jgi:toxin ParE1/3/4